jgi:hypothetical protein
MDFLLGRKLYFFNYQRNLSGVAQTIPLIKFYIWKEYETMSF